MKKLHEIVAELEAELATCLPEDYPRVCLELCKCLSYADSVRMGKLSNSLLEKTDAELVPEIRTVALCLAANSAMNQLSSGKAEKLADLAHALANELAIPRLVAQAEIELGYVYLYSNKLEQAIALAEAAHSKLVGLDNEELLRAKNLLINVHNENDHALAGKYAFDALALAEKIGKGWLIGVAYFMLGYWSRKLANPTVPGLYYFEKAKECFAQEGAKEYLISVSVTLARNLRSSGDFSHALQVEMEALQTAKELDNPRQITVCLYELGAIYARMGSIEIAESYFLEAIKLGNENESAFEEGTAATYLGHHYENCGRNEEAIYWFEHAEKIYNTTLNVTTKLSTTNHLHKLYARVGNHEKAYQQLISYLELKLKLQDEARIKETTRLQQLYEKEKRETELRELTIKQQQTELQQAESELKAIRAQMNPHFIFNALNTIQSYIYLKDNQNASNYLGKFSRLTRMILDMSNHEVVSLKDELEALTLYLQLERMRFEEVLTFDIAIAEALDTESIKLPAMLIQPYIENAIKHGLLHKKDNRELLCSFELKGDNLIVCIDDNGIGRQRSVEMNAAKGGDHKSFATQANAKRFTLLSKNSDDTIGVVYTDKTDADGQPTGTLVVLTIPVQFDGVMAN